MDAHQACLAMLRARYGDIDKALPAPGADGFMALLNLAGRHGVSPALAAGLRALVAHNPAWLGVAEILEVAETGNAARNDRLLKTARRIAGLFSESGISCVFLKGAAAVLDDPAGAPWRQLSDLDVLVPADRIEEAALLLRAQGFRQSDYETGFAGQLHHHYPALIGDDGTMIELHVRLMQDAARDPVPPADLFRRASTVMRDGQRFLVPCPDHRMFHLIAHAQISNWSYPLRQVQLRDALDARELAARHAIDWNAVDHCFAGIGAQRELDGFLLAAHDLLGLAFPFGDHRRQRSSAWAAAAVTAYHRPESRWLTGTRMAFAHARALVSNPRRLRLAWLTLVSPSRRQDFLRVARTRLADRSRNS